MGAYVKVRVLALHILQRVGVGHQVTADAVGVDELLNPRHLVDLVHRINLDICAPADGLIRNAQGFKDLIVKVLLAQEQLMHDTQEFAAACSLNDAVVIGGGQRDRFADSVLRQCFLAGPLKCGGILKGTGADDAGLSLREPGNGVHCADAAGVSQRNGGAGIVVSAQLPGAGLLHQLFVGMPEVREVHVLGFFYVRYNQQARTVRPGHIDCQAKIDMGGLNGRRLAVDDVVVDVLRGKLCQRADDRVPDEVGERDLSSARTLQMVVDDHAVVDQQLGWNGPDAGGRGNGQACVHVGGDGLGWSAEDVYRVFVHVRITVGLGKLCGDGRRR